MTIKIYFSFNFFLATIDQTSTLNHNRPIIGPTYQIRSKTQKANTSFPRVAFRRAKFNGLDDLFKNNDRQIQRFKSLQMATPCL